MNGPSARQSPAAVYAGGGEMPGSSSKKLKKSFLPKPVIHLAASSSGISTPLTKSIPLSHVVKSAGRPGPRVVKLVPKSASKIGSSQALAGSKVVSASGSKYPSAKFTPVKTPVSVGKSSTLTKSLKGRKFGVLSRMIADGSPLVSGSKYTSKLTPLKTPASSRKPSPIAKSIKGSGKNSGIPSRSMGDNKNSPLASGSKYPMTKCTPVKTQLQGEMSSKGNQSTGKLTQARSAMVSSTKSSPMTKPVSQIVKLFENKGIVLSAGNFRSRLPTRGGGIQRSRTVSTPRNQGDLSKTTEQVTRSKSSESADKRNIAVKRSLSFTKSSTKSHKSPRTSLVAKSSPVIKTQRKSVTNTPKSKTPVSTPQPKHEVSLCSTKRNRPSLLDKSDSTPSFLRNMSLLDDVEISFHDDWTQSSFEDTPKSMPFNKTMKSSMEVAVLKQNLTPAKVDSITVRPKRSNTFTLQEPSAKKRKSGTPLNSPFQKSSSGSKVLGGSQQIKKNSAEKKCVTPLLKYHAKKSTLTPKETVVGPSLKSTPFAAEKSASFIEFSLLDESLKSQSQTQGLNNSVSVSSKTHHNDSYIKKSAQQSRSLDNINQSKSLENTRRPRKITRSLFANESGALESDNLIESEPDVNIPDTPYSCKKKKSTKLSVRRSVSFSGVVENTPETSSWKLIPINIESKTPPNGSPPSPPKTPQSSIRKRKSTSLTNSLRKRSLEVQSMLTGNLDTQELFVSFEDLSSRRSSLIQHAQRVSGDFSKMLEESISTEPSPKKNISSKISNRQSSGPLKLKLGPQGSSKTLKLSLYGKTPSPLIKKTLSGVQKNQAKSSLSSFESPEKTAIHSFNLMDLDDSPLFPKTSARQSLVKTSNISLSSKKINQNISFGLSDQGTVKSSDKSASLVSDLEICNSPKHKGSASSQEKSLNRRSMRGTEISLDPVESFSPASSIVTTLEGSVQTPAGSPGRRKSVACPRRSIRTPKLLGNNSPVFKQSVSRSSKSMNKKSPLTTKPTASTPREIEESIAVLSDEASQFATQSSSVKEKSSKSARLLKELSISATSKLLGNVSPAPKKSLGRSPRSTKIITPAHIRSAGEASLVSTPEADITHSSSPLSSRDVSSMLLNTSLTFSTAKKSDLKSVSGQLLREPSTSVSPKLPIKESPKAKQSIGKRSLGMGTITPTSQRSSRSATLLKELSLSGTPKPLKEVTPTEKQSLGQRSSSIDLISPASTKPTKKSSKALADILGPNETLRSVSDSPSNKDVSNKKAQSRSVTPASSKKSIKLLKKLSISGTPKLFGKATFTPEQSLGRRSRSMNFISPASTKSTKKHSKALLSDTTDSDGSPQHISHNSSANLSSKKSSKKSAKDNRVLKELSISGTPKLHIEATDTPMQTLGRRSRSMNMISPTSAKSSKESSKSLLSDTLGADGQPQSVSDSLSIKDVSNMKVQSSEETIIPSSSSKSLLSVTTGADGSSQTLPDTPPGKDVSSNLLENSYVTPSSPKKSSQKFGKQSLGQRKKSMDLISPASTKSHKQSSTALSDTIEPDETPWSVSNSPSVKDSPNKKVHSRSVTSASFSKSALKSPKFNQLLKELSISDTPKLLREATVTPKQFLGRRSKRMELFSPASTKSTRRSSKALLSDTLGADETLHSVSDTPSIKDVSSKKVQSSNVTLASSGKSDLKSPLPNKSSQQSAKSNRQSEELSMSGTPKIPGEDTVTPEQSLGRRSKSIGFISPALKRSSEKSTKCVLPDTTGVVGSVQPILLTPSVQDLSNKQVQSIYVTPVSPKTSAIKSTKSNRLQKELSISGTPKLLADVIITPEQYSGRRSRSMDLISSASAKLSQNSSNSLLLSNTPGTSGTVQPVTDSPSKYKSSNDDLQSSCVTSSTSKKSNNKSSVSVRLNNSETPNQSFGRRSQSLNKISSLSAKSMGKISKSATPDISEVDGTLQSLSKTPSIQEVSRTTPVSSKSTAKKLFKSSNLSKGLPSSGTSQQPSGRRSRSTDMISLKKSTGKALKSLMSEILDAEDNQHSLSQLLSVRDQRKISSSPSSFKKSSLKCSKSARLLKELAISGTPKTLGKASPTTKQSLNLRSRSMDLISPAPKTSAGKAITPESIPLAETLSPSVLDHSNYQLRSVISSSSKKSVLKSSQSAKLLKALSLSSSTDFNAEDCTTDVKSDTASKSPRYLSSKKSFSLNEVVSVSSDLSPSRRSSKPSFLNDIQTTPVNKSESKIESLSSVSKKARISSDLEVPVSPKMLNSKSKSLEDLSDKENLTPIKPDSVLKLVAKPSSSRSMRSTRHASPLKNLDEIDASLMCEVPPYTSLTENASNKTLISLKKKSSKSTSEKSKKASMTRLLSTLSIDGTLKLMGVTSTSRRKLSLNVDDANTSSASFRYTPKHSASSVGTSPKRINSKGKSSKQSPQKKQMKRKLLSEFEDSQDDNKNAALMNIYGPAKRFKKDETDRWEKSENGIFAAVSLCHREDLIQMNSSKKLRRSRRYQATPFKPSSKINSSSPKMTGGIHKNSVSFLDCLESVPSRSEVVAQPKSILKHRGQSISFCETPQFASTPANKLYSNSKSKPFVRPAPTPYRPRGIKSELSVASPDASLLTLPEDVPIQRTPRGSPYSPSRSIRVIFDSPSKSVMKSIDSSFHLDNFDLSDPSVIVSPMTSRTSAVDSVNLIGEYAESSRNSSPRKLPLPQTLVTVTGKRSTSKASPKHSSSSKEMFKATTPYFSSGSSKSETSSSEKKRLFNMLTTSGSSEVSSLLKRSTRKASGSVNVINVNGEQIVTKEEIVSSEPSSESSKNVKKRSQRGNQKAHTKSGSKSKQIEEITNKEASAVLSFKENLSPRRTRGAKREPKKVIQKISSKGCNTVEEKEILAMAEKPALKTESPKQSSKATRKRKTGGKCKVTVEPILEIKEEVAVRKGRSRKMSSVIKESLGLAVPTLKTRKGCLTLTDLEVSNNRPENDDSNKNRKAKKSVGGKRKVAIPIKQLSFEKSRRNGPTTTKIYLQNTPKDKENVSPVLVGTPAKTRRGRKHDIQKIKAEKDTSVESLDIRVSKKKAVSKISAVEKLPTKRRRGRNDADPAKTMNLSRRLNLLKLTLLKLEEVRQVSYLNLWSRSRRLKVVREKQHPKLYQWKMLYLLGLVELNLLH